MKAKPIVKRAFDLVCSLPALVILAPVLALIALTIKLGSKGPVIFKQQRAGREGKPFVLYKFRTMKVDADPFGQSPTSGQDPRLIRGGRFLREYSLDELPQLVNIVKGELSVVGPRPLYVSQVSQLSDEHKQRVQVRPGLTGLSQIYARSDLFSQHSLDLEVEYVRTHSFLLDLKIIFLTFGVVLGKKGVYER